ncbi:unnamed protein product [Discula destructiva]
MRSFTQTTAHDLLSRFLSVHNGYLTGLTFSVVVYRVFLHPLTQAGFPGPWYAPISKIWNVWAARHRKNHLVLHALNQKYGDFVRTGPSEVAIFHPDIYQATDGPRGESIKSEFYDVLHPRSSLVTTRDKRLHGVRRREWSGGFTSKALQTHMSKIFPHLDELVDLIDGDIRQGRPSTMREYIYWFGFDAMGQFVFSTSFGMLHNRQMHYIIKRLQSALSLLGPLAPAPWLIQVGLHLLPRVGKVKDWYDSLDWCEQQMRRRIRNAELGVLESGSDLAYYLVEEERNRKAGPGAAAKAWNLAWLAGDSLLAIVAGSDPSTATIIGILAELGQHPEHAERIYEELVTIDSIQDVHQLSKLPHLNAVVNETMRLYPALLSAGSRKTTKNGLTVGDKFIPPETTIICPRYSAGRRNDCWVHPDEFIPERWTSRPELILNSAGFAPFGLGSQSCLGRVLAEDLMRCLVARLVFRYRIRLAPGETGKRVMEDMDDQFIPYPGPLDLSFELRTS